MIERISEKIGFILGYPLGLLFAGGSILRNSRFFHPRGVLFCGEVETYADSPVDFPPHALIRFSSAWWKFREWPDALGLAVRMSEHKLRSPAPYGSDIDLLFASFRRPWEMFVSPFNTDHTDFLSNNYYAISPFLLSDNTKVDFLIDPSRGTRPGGDREETLRGTVLSGRVVLRLMMRVRGQENWKVIARIRLLEESPVDQEALRFFPFRTGGRFRPAGFLHHLRFGPYKMSQLVRPGSEVTEGEMTTD